MATQEVSRGEPTRRLLAGHRQLGPRLARSDRPHRAIGSVFLPDFLSVEYLIQQLRIASFLGIIATGRHGRDPARPHRSLDTVDDDRRRHGGDDDHGLRRAMGRSCHPRGPPRRPPGRPDQRRRRRRHPPAVDDPDARHERGAAWTDGRLHRRLRAPDQGVAPDALARAGEFAAGHTERAVGLARARRVRRPGAAANRIRAGRSSPSAIARSRAISRASGQGG